MSAPGCSSSRDRRALAPCSRASCSACATSAAKAAAAMSPSIQSRSTWSHSPFQLADEATDDRAVLVAQADRQRLGVARADLHPRLGERSGPQNRGARLVLTGLDRDRNHHSPSATARRTVDGASLVWLDAGEAAHIDRDHRGAVRRVGPAKIWMPQLRRRGWIFSR